MRRLSRTSVLWATAVLALGLVAGCGGDDDDPSPATTVTTVAPSTTTTAPATSSTTADGGTTSTTAPPGPGGPTTTGVGFQPGQPCPLGSDPDCIDPDGSGEGVYLIGGADCMAAGYPEICADLDGDGYAGYPDQG